MVYWLPDPITENNDYLLFQVMPVGMAKHHTLCSHYLNCATYLKNANWTNRCVLIFKCLPCYISADQSDHNPAFPSCSCRLLQWSAYSVLCLMICSSLREQCIDGHACAVWKTFSVSGRIKHITLNKYEIELQAMCSEAKQNSSQQPTMSMTQSYITCSTLLFSICKILF